MSRDIHTETIRVGMLGQGDPGRLAFVKATLRREEELGWFDIVSLTDEVAVIRWRNLKMMALLGGEAVRQ